MRVDGKSWEMEVKTVARLRTTMALLLSTLLVLWRIYSVGHKSRLTLVIWLLVNTVPQGHRLIRKWPRLAIMTFIHINERGAQSTPRQKPSAMGTLLTF